MDRQLLSKMSQFVVKLLLESEHSISVDVGQNDLNDVVTNLVVREGDEIFIIKEKHFTVKSSEFTLVIAQTESILYKSCDYFIGAAIIKIFIYNS